jgi:hypothetical protein
MTVNFSLLALDQILNNAATLLHMSGGQLNVPLVIRMTTGAGRRGRANPEARSGPSRLDAARNVRSRRLSSDSSFLRCPHHHAHR